MFIRGIVTGLPQQNKEVERYAGYSRNYFSSKYYILHTLIYYILILNDRYLQILMCIDDNVFPSRFAPNALPFKPYHFAE